MVDAAVVAVIAVVGVVVVAGLADFGAGNSAAERTSRRRARSFC